LCGRNGVEHGCEPLFEQHEEGRAMVHAVMLYLH
jgi:hypothetical protein